MREAREGQKQAEPRPGEIRDPREQREELPHKREDPSEPQRGTDNPVPVERREREKKDLGA